MTSNSGGGLTKHSSPLGANIDPMTTGTLVFTDDEISHRDCYDDGNSYMNGNANHSLLPVIRWKVDEFFFRWMALPSTIRYLEEVAVKVSFCCSNLANFVGAFLKIYIFFKIAI